MFINKAKNLDNILNNRETGIADSNEVDFAFKLHRNAAMFYLSNQDAKPSTENYQDAANYIKETTGVELSVEQAERILNLFPSARIKLAVYNGCRDSEVRELVYEAACGFFAGSEAPYYGDEVKIDRFITHLQAQAKAMGYNVVKFFGEEKTMKDRKFDTEAVNFTQEVSDLKELKQTVSIDTSDIEALSNEEALAISINASHKLRLKPEDEV